MYSFIPRRALAGVFCEDISTTGAGNQLAFCIVMARVWVTGTFLRLVADRSSEAFWTDACKGRGGYASETGSSIQASVYITEFTLCSQNDTRADESSQKCPADAGAVGCHGARAVPMAVAEVLGCVRRSCAPQESGVLGSLGTDRSPLSPVSREG